MTVRFTGLLREVAGTDCLQLEVAGSLSREEFLRRLSERFGEEMARVLTPAEARESDVVLALNGRIVPRGKPLELRAGDQVDLLMPLAGG